MRNLLLAILLYPLTCSSQSKIRIKPGTAYPPTNGALTYDTIEVFNQTFDAALSGKFASAKNTTSDYTISGGKLTFPVANGSYYQYSKQIAYDQATLSENCIQKATIICNSIDFAYGVGIGWRSINTQGFTWSVYGFYNFNTYSSNKGKVGVVASSGGDFYSPTSVTAPSVYDTIDLTITRRGINYITSIFNRNKNLNLSYEFVTYPSGSPFVAHQVAVPVINWMGGGFSVLNWSYYLVKPRDPQFIILGNSITYGQSATTQAQRYADLVVNKNYNIVSGGGGDVTQDVVNRLAEIKLLHPKYALIMIGGNDVFFAYASSTWQNNLKKIRDSLVSYGIIPIHLYPTARTIVDERPLRNFLDTCSKFSTDKKIDLFTATLKSGTNYALSTEYDSGDGVHPSNAGHTLMAAVINAKLVEWGYDKIAGTELKKIKIIVRKRN